MIRRLAVAVAALVVVGPILLVLGTDWRARGADALYPPLGGFIPAGDGWLHCVRRGEGPPVVLVHGNPGSVRDFLPEVVDRLAASYDVVACDRPGHGHSERPELAENGPADQAWMLFQALEEMRVERPILVGHSWGGGLALRYALEYPAEAAGLVLVGTLAYPHFDEDRLSKLLRTPYLGSLLRHTLPVVIGGRRVADGLAEAYAPDPVRPEHLASARRLWTRPQQIGAMVWDRRLHDLTAGDAAALYREVGLPVEIVAGDADALLEDSLRLARALPGARLEVLAGAGHHLPQSRPEAVVTAVDRLAARIAAGTP